MNERNTTGTHEEIDRVPRLLGLLIALGLLAAMLVSNRGEERSGVISACVPEAALERQLATGGSADFAPSTGWSWDRVLLRSECNAPTAAIERPAPSPAPVALDLAVSASRQPRGCVSDAALSRSLLPCEQRFHGDAAGVFR